MKRTVSMKGAISTVVALVLAVVMTFGVTACSSGGDEQFIRANVSEVLDVFKNPTKENMSKFVGEDTSYEDQLAAYGIDVYEFLQHCFSRYSYEIGEIKVDGDTATAAVTVTNVNMTTVMTAAQEDLMSHAEELQEKYADSSDESMKSFMQEYFNMIYDEIDATDDMVTTDVTLDLTKDSEGWHVDSDSEKELISAMYGGIDLSSVGA